LYNRHYYKTDTISNLYTVIQIDVSTADVEMSSLNYKGKK